MKIAARVATLLLLFAAALPLRAQRSATEFVPARVQTASDIPYPIDTTTSGLVSFVVSLDEQGHMTDVQTVRDVPPLTSAALVALKSWTFAAAVVSGKPVASHIDVDVLFNPGNASFGDVPPLLTPASSPQAVPESQPAPPHALTAVFANYPVNTMVAGPVVFDAQIGRSGRVVTAKPVYTTASLVGTATSAAKKWRFSPGRLNGAAVRSDTVIAFVFRSSTISTPYGSTTTH
jgi:hypothetical protein